jgi:hypothetical protein
MAPCCVCRDLVWSGSDLGPNSHFDISFFRLKASADDGCPKCVVIIKGYEFFVKTTKEHRIQVWASAQGSGLEVHGRKMLYFNVRIGEPDLCSGPLIFLTNLRRALPVECYRACDLTNRENDRS